MSMGALVHPTTPLDAGLADDRETVNAELTALVRPIGAKPTPFRMAMEYSVLGPGQRIRPILSLRIARTLGLESALMLRAASAVELIHCASLIVDDLPCMDNETSRRGRACTHIVYGESTALLAAFGLVGLAGRCLLSEPAGPSLASALLSFQSTLLGVLDLAGLCEGQDMDLRIQGEERALLRSRINELKTVPLFELAGHAGSLPLDPGSASTLAAVGFARSFGRAFQLVDDFLDGELANRAPALAAIRRSRGQLAGLPHSLELHELLDALASRLNERRP